MSKEFDILRGTKQGDPLSSLLFNAVLEDIFAEVKPAWEKRILGDYEWVSAITDSLPTYASHMTYCSLGRPYDS